MPLYDEIAQELVDEAGKSGPNALAVARRALDRVLDHLNRSVDSEYLEEMDHSVSVSANDASIDLPESVKTVLELGRWNSVTEGIDPPWTEITQREWHLRGGASGTTAEVGTLGTAPREFFFLEYGSGSQSGGFRLRIRPVPVLSESITLAVRSYVALDSSNCEKVGSDVLYSGAQARLPRWFPDAFMAARTDFRRAKTVLMKKHAGIIHPIRMGVHPMVAANNRLQRRLNS